MAHQQAVEQRPEDQVQREVDVRRTFDQLLLDATLQQQARGSRLRAMNSLRNDLASSVSDCGAATKEAVSPAEMQKRWSEMLEGGKT